MLKLNLAMLTILMMIILNKHKSSWWINTASLFILSFMSIQLMSSNMSTLSSISMMDQLSQSLIMLSILISALMMMTSTKIIYNNNMSMTFQLLNVTLTIILINCFSSSNLLLFYILFEASLIPTMLIIMLWGYQPERMQASMYMMIYTIIASLPMLLMFILIMDYSTSMNFTTMTLFTPNNFNFMFYLFSITGFLVKLPMFTSHLWLPKAHVEAPIAGSMVLAAILLKLGGYGIIRLMMNSEMISKTTMPIITSMSLIGAILTSMICLRQPDLKSMIAYSSMGHMGLMLAGMLSNSIWGMTGATMMMIAHGLSSSALFSLANINYEFSNTRSLFLMKGMLSILPTMSMWWFLFAAANMAAPPSINLLSEILLITSITSLSLWTTPFLMMITFLAGAYSLHMYSATQHGQNNNFSNPMTYSKPKDFLMLLIHITPLALIILKPELIMLWM